MTIATVAVDDPVLASTHKQIIDNVNSSPSLILLAANGLWQVPSGVHKFKVSIGGGGGRGGAAYEGGTGESFFLVPGYGGLRGCRALAFYSGVAVGTSFAVTVGAGGNVSTPKGGTTSFGTFAAPGGWGGDYLLANPGATLGAATFPPGQPQFYGGTEIGVLEGQGVTPYGWGGIGGTPEGVLPTDGKSGFVIIEW